MDIINYQSNLVVLGSELLHANTISSSEISHFIVLLIDWSCYFVALLFLLISTVLTHRSGRKFRLILNTDLNRFYFTWIWRLMCQVSLLLFSFFIISNVYGVFYGQLLDSAYSYYAFGHVINGQTQILKFIIWVCWFFVLYYISQQCLRIEKLILIFFLLPLSCSLISADNIIFFYLSLEAFSFILYILAIINNSVGGIVAGIRYFLFGTLGSILMLGGLVTVLLTTPMVDNMTINFSFYYHLCKQLMDGLAPSPTFAGLSLILFGLLVKIGIVPFHNWVIEIYPSVSLDINLLYAVFVKLILVILFYKLNLFSLLNINIEFLALLSVIIGTGGALQQTEIRKFLAYSSIAHTGLILFTDQFSVWFYISTYLLSLSLIFCVLLIARINGQELVYLSDLRFIQLVNPTTRLHLSIGFLSLSGLPPLAGFFGKLSLLTVLIDQFYLSNDYNSYAIFIIFLILTLVMSFYYFRLVKFLFITLQLKEIEQTIVYVIETRSQRIIRLTIFVLVCMSFFWISPLIDIFTLLSNFISG